MSKSTSHLALYYIEMCPFCTKVRNVIDQLGLDIELREAYTAPFQEQLVSGGGKNTVPCLRIDSENGTEWMYESGEIIRYLESKFS